jgi:hypothetical protein
MITVGLTFLQPELIQLRELTTAVRIFVALVDRCLRSLSDSHAVGSRVRRLCRSARPTSGQAEHRVTDGTKRSAQVTDRLPAGNKWVTNAYWSMKPTVGCEASIRNTADLNSMVSSR